MVHRTEEVAWKRSAPKLDNPSCLASSSLGVMQSRSEAVTCRAAGRTGHIGAPAPGSPDSLTSKPVKRRSIRFR